MQDKSTTRDPRPGSPPGLAPCSGRGWPPRPPHAVSVASSSSTSAGVRSGPPGNFRPGNASGTAVARCFAGAWLLTSFSLPRDGDPVGRGNLFDQIKGHFCIDVGRRVHMHRISRPASTQGLLDLSRPPPLYNFYAIHDPCNTTAGWRSFTAVAKFVVPYRGIQSTIGSIGFSYQPARNRPVRQPYAYADLQN